MVAEILTGIALVSSAVKGIKSAIGTAKDVSDIANDIDNLFKGKEEVKQQAHPLASKWDKFLGKTLGDSADRLSIGAIAKETIEEKLAEEQIRKVRMMVNRRFGGGTWDGILLERKKRLEDHKNKVKKEKARKRKRLDKIYKVLEYVGSVILVIASSVLVFWLIISNMKK